MAIANFKEEFSDRYQDILQKTLVAMKVANTRFQSDLKYGDKVHRFSLDLSNVLVRTVTRGSDQTIDTLSDSDQTLDIDQQKGAAFAIPDWDKVQAGPLNPAEIAGKEVAHKVRQFIDADVFAQVVNAYQDFDTGDLTTLSSNGTPIVVSTTNVPQILSKVKAKLKRINVDTNGLVFVGDGDLSALFEQTLMGKNIELAGSVYKNGYTGPMGGLEIYESNNLTGEAVLHMDLQPSNGETVVINGVTFTFKTALSAGPAVAGEVLIGGSADAARANLAALINAPGTTTVNGTAFSGADLNTLLALRITATNNNSTDDLTIVAVGSGRLTLSETLAGDSGETWTKNFIHCYVGKKGAIDLVIQDGIMPDLRDEPKQKTKNVLIDALYGVKTFTDGAKYFLDVLIDTTSA